MNGNRKTDMSQAILAAVYIALGIILICYPGFTGILICRAAGLLALAVGGVREVSALRTRGAGFFSQLNLAIHVVLMGFGLFALAQPVTVLSILPVVLGVYLLMECVGKLQRAFALKELGFPRWWAALGMGLLAAVLGVTLLLNPFGAVETMLRFLGLSLVIDGVTDFWILWCFASHG